MADPRNRIVVEAHALRSLTATAVLLHGSRRSPRDLPKPLSRLVISLLVGGVLLLAIFATARLGGLTGR